MDTLLHRFGAIIKGTIEGFDRLVFKGYCSHGLNKERKKSQHIELQHVSRN